MAVHSNCWLLIPYLYYPWLLLYLTLLYSRIFVSFFPNHHICSSEGLHIWTALKWNFFDNGARAPFPFPLPKSQMPLHRLRRTRWETINEIAFVKNQGLEGGSHCLGMSYYVNFRGGLGSNEFHIKWIFSTHSSWKNQNPGGLFEATS